LNYALAAIARLTLEAAADRPTIERVLTLTHQMQGMSRPRAEEQAAVQYDSVVPRLVKAGVLTTGDSASTLDLSVQAQPDDNSYIINGRHYTRGQLMGLGVSLWLGR